MIPLNNSIYKLNMVGQFIRKKRFAFFKNLQKLKRSQYYPKERLREIQTKKLKQLVKYSYDNVPYYHQLFKNNNIHPNDIKTLDDLKKIPLLRKKIIQRNFNKMISNKIGKNNLLENHTGGSTGKPLTFYQCKNYLNYADAGRILAWYIIPGFDYGARTAILWGAERDIRKSQPFLYRLRNYCNGTITMNSFRITDEKFEAFVRCMNQFKPFILRGYSSSLYLLAKYIEKYQTNIPDLSCVISSAEVLHEHQRKKLEKVFGCHILNSYGCREVSQIAMECLEHNGLHVFMENQIVEILDSNEDVAPNEIGDVVVTNLNNFGMPFIRYKIEDMARQSPIDKCNCNRGLSLIGHIIGREQSRIITPGGSFIEEGYFKAKFFGVPGIKEYQIIQNTIDNIMILIVENPDLSKNKIELIRKQMMTEIDENIQIQIKYVDQIERSESGKYRFVISKVH